MPNKLLHTYLTSKELKGLIVQRSIEFQLPLRYICHKVGISHDSFMRSYINGGGLNLEIEECQFEQILEILGISIRFQFVVQREYNACEVQGQLKEEYELSKENK